MMYRMKTILNNKSLYILYCSLVLPYMSYCVEVWGNNYKTAIKPIFLLQKKAIRIVSKSDYYAPTNSLFIDLYTLKLQDIVELNTAIIMYKAYNHLLPTCVQELFHPRESQYDLRGTAIFIRNDARINNKARCVSVIGIKLWNSLDIDLKNCSSINTFKKIYKAKAINKYRTLE